MKESEMQKRHVTLLLATIEVVLRRIRVRQSHPAKAMEHSHSVIFVRIESVRNVMTGQAVRQTNVTCQAIQKTTQQIVNALQVTDVQQVT
jgi:hypothetical protein